MKWFRSMMVALLLVSGGGRVCADAVAEIWQLDAMYRFSEAYQFATELPADDRAGQLAKAVTMLNLPTKTQSNIDAAAAILATLAGADDETGIRAQYFLGRVAQAHNLGGPDFPKARALFRKLFAAHPEHSLAQLGYVQAVLMELHDRQAADSLAARLKRLEAERPVLADREVWKNYHLALGRAYLGGGVSKQKALEHYLLADEVGVVRWRERGDFYAAILSLARDTGRKDVAAAYCRKFLRDYPRDQRSFIVSGFLNELGGKP